VSNRSCSRGARRCALLSLAAAFAFLLLASATGASAASRGQALPEDFWGAVPQANLSAAQLKRVHRGGVESIRIPINWSNVQPTEGGAFDWAGVDDQVEMAARGHVDLLPFMVGVPAWAEKLVYVGGSRESVQVPANLPVKGKARAGWLAFLRAAVDRYGSNGSFWSTHPDVPKRPIRNWQIWNEPNFKYFVHRPDPAEYGQLVKISSNAIKSEDHRGKVILAGLFVWPKGGETKHGNHNLFATDFLNRMYRQVPGIASRFDAVALHPYSPRYTYLPRQIREVREVLKRRHDPKVGIWVTEMGWSSKPPAENNSFAKGPAGQARELKGAFSLLVRNQRRWNVQRVYWFSIDDYGTACNFCDGSGLFAAGFKPKRSWYAYVHFAGGRP